MRPNFLFNVGLCWILFGKSITAAEDFIHYRNFTYQIPISGFISAKSESKPITLRIKNKVNGPGLCNNIELTNIPKDNSSPLLGSSNFYLVPNKLFNDHFSWSNGVETLSFIGHGNGKGNWILGSEPGVDAGYVFISAEGPSVSPIGLESSTVSWHWLMEKTWVAQPDLMAVCRDKYAVGGSFYEIEYYNSSTRSMFNSLFIPDINPHVFTLQKNTSPAERPTEMTVVDGPGAMTYPAFLDQISQQWKLLVNVDLVIDMGLPMLIREEENTDRSGQIIQEESTELSTEINSVTSALAVMVNQEHAATGGWSITLRKYSVDLHGEKYSVSSEGTAEKGQKQVEEKEYYVILDNNGFRGKTQVLKLPSNTQESVHASTIEDLLFLGEGEYVWMWYSTKDFPGIPVPKAIPKSQSYVAREETQEVLLKCVGRTKDKLVFQYFPSHRQDAMRQTVLSRDTDYLTMTFPCLSTKGSVNPCQGESKSPIIKYQDTELSMRAVFPIGKDVFGFLKTHLLKKEGRIPGISSCYLYHAAVSMPQSLVYAAEFLCVLLGAKPVTMIQYTSPSDLQWKFPLVQELTRAVALTKHLLGEDLDIEIETFKYRNDESLIVYRKSRRYLAHQLRPFREAQALHPAPYPDSVNPVPDWKLQIFNSAYNGFVLGYPKFFVQSYCDSFHNNGLSQEERRQLFREARTEYELMLASFRKREILIKFGNDPSLAPETMKMIEQLALRS